MNHGVYSIYDSKAGAFHQPFFSVNDQTAARACAAALDDSGTQLAKFPEDFTLYKVGFFDDAKGQLVPLERLENLGLLLSMRKGVDHA